MNPAPIAWAADALIVLACLGAFIIAFVIVSACRLSSLISRDEEDRELRADFDRLNRAA